MTDAFEKELEKDMAKALSMMKKKYPEETRVANAGNVLVLRKFLDLYRSPSIRADRLASALEEVVEDKTTLAKITYKADWDGNEIQEYEKEATDYRRVKRAFSEAASAIRNEAKKEEK